MTSDGRPVPDPAPGPKERGARPTGGAPRRIVVGFDGSPPSLRAVRLGVSLANAGGRVWILHASEPGRAVAEPLTDEESGAPIRAVTKSIASLVTEAKSRSVHAEGVVRDGPPAELLWRLAREVGAELVVVGTRGLGGTARLLLGSVSSRVVEHATLPVVVVP